MNFPQRVPLMIDGKWVESRTEHWLDVTNPADQQVLSRVPFATDAEVDTAIASAAKAFETWKNVPIPQRARLMFRYQELLKEHHDELAEIICQELGKNFEDAKGDVWRGIEVVEYACNIASLMMGETVENVAGAIDTYSLIQPIGVCAGITPFNFPAMIPLWMFPLANACGNTFVLKPSEQDPLTAVRLLELYAEAGAPEGIVQLVHGGKDCVNKLCSHPDIRAVSFVGSIAVGKHVYRTATQNLKRVQCMTGAKNHMVVMPDANRQQAVNNIIGAAFGAAGQRCMAISVVVMVGKAQDMIADVVAAARDVSPGIWSDPKAAYGPQISGDAKSRILGLISEGKEEGAECLLDGTDFRVDGYPDGNWIGPTVFGNVTADMQIYREEVFGPVLCLVNAESLEDAIALINDDFRANGTSIFTDSGAAARKFQNEVQVGQVGINIPIPVPLPFFSFTGWRGSFHGDQHPYGKQAVRFYTETKTVTARWFESDIPSGPNMSIVLK